MNVLCQSAAPAGGDWRQTARFMSYRCCAPRSASGPVCGSVGQVEDRDHVLVLLVHPDDGQRSAGLGRQSACVHRHRGVRGRCRFGSRTAGASPLAWRVISSSGRPSHLDRVPAGHSRRSGRPHDQAGYVLRHPVDNCWVRLESSCPALWGTSAAKRPSVAASGCGLDSDPDWRAAQTAGDGTSAVVDATRRNLDESGAGTEPATAWTGMAHRRRSEIAASRDDLQSPRP